MVKVPKGLLCLLSMVLLVRSLVVGRSAGLMKNARAVLRTRAGALNLCMSTSSSSVSEIKLTAQSTTSDKLRVLRQAMNKASIDCFIVPTDDPHMSEYTAFYYNRREWLSGFTGSAGTVIVTNNEALLFTDGRYHNQAELELTKEWTLMRQGNKDVPAPIEWMSTRLPPGAVVGVDPFVHAALNMKKINSELSAKHITVKSLSENPIDALWTEKQGRAAPPKGLVRVHPLEYAGKAVETKLDDIRQAMTKVNAVALVSASLDEIAWMYNIRGSDVPCNPVSVAYAVVTRASPGQGEGAWLFIDETKVPTETAQHLKQAGVAIRPYEQALSFVCQLGATTAPTATNDGSASAGIGTDLLKQVAITGSGDVSSSSRSESGTDLVKLLGGELLDVVLNNNLGKGKSTDGGSGGGMVWMDPKTVNFAVYSSVSQDRRLDKESPITLMKATKNAGELKGMRACHLRDGAAESEFLAWLEEELALQHTPHTPAPTGGGAAGAKTQQSKGFGKKTDGSTATTSSTIASSTSSTTITEVDLDERVTASRAALSPGMFLEPSFPTIAGVNSNGAIVHYRAVPSSTKTLGPHDMVLLDSGGQYLDGTTDVTRTFHTGEPSAVQREMFTRVLKGHIGVDSRVFVQGTPGVMLDSYAREHLWAIGKDYNHGTGHGVGAALNVHEGPHSISRVLNGAPLVPGMVVSNEPGYYEANNYGIRIENLLAVVEKKELGEFNGRSFLGFERLTHIPIQKKLMDKSLMTPIEIAWVDRYHREIRERVGPLMITDRGRKWLEAATSPL